MKRWCPLRDAIAWMSKATGIGYTAPPIITTEGKVTPDQLTKKADEVVRQVELLEWELRRSRLYTKDR